MNQQDLGGNFRPAQMVFLCKFDPHIAITTRELSTEVSISSVLLDYRAISCKQDFILIPGTFYRGILTACINPTIISVQA